MGRSCRCRSERLLCCVDDHSGVLNACSEGRDYARRSDKVTVTVPHFTALLYINLALCREADPTGSQESLRPMEVATPDFAHNENIALYKS